MESDNSEQQTIEDLKQTQNRLIIANLCTTVIQKYAIIMRDFREMKAKKSMPSNKP